MADDHRIRVAHVITRMILGGAQENTLLTVLGLRDDPRYRPLLVTGPSLGPEGSLLERARASGVDVHVIGSLRRAIHPVLDFVSFWRLLAFFLRARPTIVHTHSAKAGILGRLAAWVARVPVIVHTVHGLSFHPYQSRWLNALYIALERLVAPMTDRWICVADAMRDQSLAAGIGDVSRYVTIRSGMELEPFLQAASRRDAVRADFGFAASDVVFAKVARLAVLKGHEFLLAAFQSLALQYPQARLLLVGDGALRAELEAEVQVRGLAARVTFTGLVPPERIPELLAASDAVVHASLREGLARVLPQAYLCGRPVIAFDVDGAREVVVPGHPGWLVPPGDVAALARAMQARLEDAATAFRMAEQGREVALRQFSAAAMVRDIRAEYEQRVPPGTLPAVPA